MIGVLLLNASFEPLRVINLPRAIGLLTSGKVDVIETVPGRELRSPRVRIPMPSVLRLHYYVNVPRRGATWSRRGVLMRDRYTCQYCGKRLTGHEATIDHIIPQWKCRVNRIPPNTWSNTVASCAKCQQRKGGRAMHEAGMRFIDPNFEPKTPRVNYLVVASGIRPEWKQYIRL
jgi:5-methylcytosine-specific restriction endonuclease McrA